MLPGRDGIEVLKAIRRATPALPVILLTAKAEVADRVEGLDLGATDYVTKPFAFEELLARIRARLRDGGDGAETTLAAGGIELDLLSREATRGDQTVRLPEREAELLAYLMRHAGRVCTREEILAAVWGYDHDPGTNVVQVYIGYLRRKLALPGSPAPIETVRSVGYRLRRASERPWRRLGLRGRLALSIGAIVVARLRRRLRRRPGADGRRVGGDQARGGREHGPAAGRPARSRRAPLDLADQRRPVRRREDLPPGRRSDPGRRAARRLPARRPHRVAAAAVRRRPRAEVDAGDLTPRLRVGPGDAAELRTLAEAFNHMLDRLDQAFARQRQFVSDASHELRSPLTAIRGQLEVLARSEQPERRRRCAGSRRWR